MMNYNEYLTNYLENLSDDELLEMWNTYCLEVGNEGYIYENDDYFFEENFSNINDAVRAVCYGDYRYMDEYVVFNGYANLESFSGYDLKEHIYIYELVDACESNGFLLDEYELVKNTQEF